MKFLKKIFRPFNWHNLRTTKPISNKFGIDRGTPIDRYYIEDFLKTNSASIKGCTLEIGENTYTKKFGTNVTKSLILNFSGDNSTADIIGDLTDLATLPENLVDSFICTQTFNFIYDFKKAIQGAHYILKPGGTLLVTLAGLCQISRYDMDRWGDYWRFTTQSASQAFSDIFGKNNVQVSSYGNVLSSISLLHGISVEELKTLELDINDPNYQIIITVTAKKC